MSDQIYQTSGPITDPNSPIYVSRVEGSRALELIMQMRYVTILGAHQTGKTSLLYKLRAELERMHYIPVLVNLSNYEHCDQSKWYGLVSQGIIDSVRERIVAKARRRLRRVANPAEFKSIFGRLATHIGSDARIVIMFDNIDTVPESIADDFFGVLCTICDDSGIITEYQQIVFVTAGAAHPNDLISEENYNSPFFLISEHLYLGDFDLGESDNEGVRKLTSLLTPDPHCANYVYEYTGGHPNLTQKVCAALERTGESTFPHELVDQVVDELVRSGDDNLVRICRKIDSDETIEGLAQDLILHGKVRKFDLTNPVVTRLTLIGVVKQGEGNSCVIRNRIYEKTLKNHFHRPSRDWTRATRIGLFFVAALAILSIVWLFPALSDVVQAKVLHKSNQKTITGLYNSKGEEISVTVYSPRLLDAGESETIEVVSHDPEVPIIGVIPRTDSGLVVTRDKDNPCKFDVEWRDTSSAIIPLRWVEYRQVDVVAQMPITGTQPITATVAIKTNYLSSILAAVSSAVIGIAASVAAFGENAKKAWKLLSEWRKAGQSTAPR